MLAPPKVQTTPQATLPGRSSDPPVGSQVTNAVHDSSNGGAQSGSSLDAGSSGVQTSPQAILPGGSSDPPVDPHFSTQVVQQQPGQPLQTDNEDVFVDASDSSDIEESPQSFPPSSQTISEFSQSHPNAQDVQNDSVVPGTVVVPTVVDVYTMDPSLASLKRRSDSPVDFRRPRRPSPGSRRKHRRVVSASPQGHGQHRRLPLVARDRPSRN